MKTNLAVTLAVLGLALACVRAEAEGTNRPSGGGTQGDKTQQRNQDQLQTSSSDLDQKHTRLHESLPGTVQQAVQDMQKERERYQQELQRKKKEMTVSTDEERERLRERLRAVIREQARDREQLRERLQALRETIPTHDQLIEQAREQLQQRERRGD